MENQVEKQVEKQAEIQLENQVKVERMQEQKAEEVMTLPEKKHLGHKIKGLWESLVNDVFRKYTVTVVSIMLATLLGAILIEPGDMNEALEELLSKIMFFSWMFATGALAAEEFLHKKLIPKIVGFGISAVYAWFFVFLLDYRKSSLFGMDSEIFMGFALYYYVCIIISLFVLSVHHMYKNSGLSLEQYVISGISNVAQTTIVYSLFAGGIAIVVAIFNVLIFDTGMFLIRLEIFLAGGIFLPALILAISKVSEKVGKFMWGVVRNVLLPLLIAAFVIIYLYIFRIIFSLELPSNEVFMILSVVFALGLPIWTMAGHNKEKMLGKINAWLPVAFIPFIILQCICIGIRLYHYGITPTRYYACALIVFEIIYVFLYLFRKGIYLDKIFHVACIVCFIVIACPFVNAEYVNVLVHKGVVEDAMEKGLDELTTNEEVELKEAYRIIYYECGAEGEYYLTNRLGSDAEILREWYYNYGSVSDDVIMHGERVNLNGHNELEELDVSDYSRIIRVYGYGDEPVDDILNLVLIKDNQMITSELDLTDWHGELLRYYTTENYETYQSFVQENMFISINEQYDLYIESFIISGYEDGYVDSLRLDGYLLEK